MFSATYFTYDGIFSGSYGLMIADFDTNQVNETSAFPCELAVVKPSVGNRFYHSGIKYDSPPIHQFSVISEEEISDTIRREILSWLIGRKEYKKLTVHQVDLENYYYNCVFTNPEIIFVNGRCHGFRVTANFDSWFACGAPSKLKINEAGTHTVTIYNRSDIKDGYTYPTVKFEGSNIKITNLTDDTTRVFEFSGLEADEQIVVDNETKYISSNKTGEKLSAFKTKKWLRLRKGANQLEIVSSGAVEITCPCYVMIGF